MEGVEWLRKCPPGSRDTLYIPSFDPILHRNGNILNFVCRELPPEGEGGLLGCLEQGGEVKIKEEEEIQMSRVTFEKKMSNPERKRPPLYRPKSRSDTARSSSRLDTSRSRADQNSSDEDLARQNTDLRQRLQDEASLYRRRLDTYRQAQQNQAALVSRLQAKVLQYKQRCAELEDQIVHHDEHDHHKHLPIPSTSSSALEQAQQHLREIREERVTDLETALRRLDDERGKCEKMMQLNSTLRDQLDESRRTNENLTADLQKLTNDFEELREEMIVKEDEWKDEEQAFNDYYSTEHNRLLNLWRDVVGIKRLFMDVQSTTEKDLTKLKMEISSMGREASHAVGRLDRNISMESLFAFKEKPYDESGDLKSQVEVLKTQNDNAQVEIKMKEDKIQQLMKDFQTLEERCEAAEKNLSQSLRLQEDLDILHGALRDITHALMQDSETKEQCTGASHVHLSAQMMHRPQKPSKTNVSPAAFAESTISAVQAALHKYQSMIHELQVKLQSNKEQLMLVRKQYENSEENAQAMEQRLKELIAQLDANRAQLSHCSQERDSLHKALESFKAENLALDKHRVEINCMVEGLNSDYEKLQKENHRLQKDLDMIHEEKIFLQTEMERLNQNAEHQEMNLRAEEDRCSRMREELLVVREELNKLYLNHDLLEQQKIEAEELIASLEKSKTEAEQKLDKVMGERSNVSDNLAKQESVVSNLEQDKKKLRDEIKKLEEEKTTLQSQSTDHQNDIQSLRKELLQAEQQKLNLESEKVTLTEKTKFLEIEKGKVEMELGQVARERNDLTNQLTVIGRKKDALNDELIRTRQKLEQASETNSRINRNLEELVRECEEKQCSMDALDKELQRLSEQLASLRCEKESLEGVLFDTQTNLETSENKKFQLEKDQQELLIKQESLKGQISRLTKDLERSEKKLLETKTTFNQQISNQEGEFNETILNLKKINEDNLKKLTEEKEKIRTTLEKKLQQNLQQLSHEKDQEINKLIERIENLQNHIDNLCQQHEELMLRAENDKQQALLLAHHDHQALQIRLDECKKELEIERENLEKLKRESHLQYESDRSHINQLKEELNKYKGKLEETKQKCEEERIKLEHKIEEILSERDQGQNEIENLKVQLHLSEDKIDDLHNQLHETIRKLKEGENHLENLRKDLIDLRRQLNDCNIEKEKYHSSNKELREFIKRIEQEKREIMRQNEDNLQKITNFEEIKSTIENEKLKLTEQLKEGEKDQLILENKIKSLQEDLQRQQNSGLQAQAEEKELQARLLNEIEERERTQQEIHESKKQIAELERNLDQTRLELSKTRSHSVHHEEQFHAREQDLLIHLEDGRSREKKLEDQKHNLEVCLVDATQQIQELKAKLSGCEGRIKALDGQLNQNEVLKREIEQKLHSIVSTLRRIAGIQLDGSLTQPYRLMSPSRRYSPARTSQEHDGDIDPEIIRKGVRNLMQQVAQIERERDDFKTQLISLKKQLNEAHENQNKGDNKLSKLMNNLRNLQDEKSSLEIKLNQKIKNLQNQNEIYHKKCEENQLQRDKITSLELNLNTNNEEKIQLEDKIEKLKNQLSRCENEKRNFQEELSRIENRATKLELQRLSTEGDIQRLQMMLQDKDNQIQKLIEKTENQSKIISNLEERCVSLKTTIDQLTTTLDRASTTENELKQEIQTLHRSLVEANSASHSGIERLKHLQKSLTNCENEKRVLNERMDGCQQTVAELRRNNQILQDQINRLNNELSNCEVQKSGLESQLRMSQWPDNISTNQDDDLMRQLQTIQREKTELKGKIDTMSYKMKQLESDKRNLERNLQKTSLTNLPSSNLQSSTFKTLPSSQKEKYLDNDRESHLEQENRDLKLKIQKLENELTEKETELTRLKTLHPSSLLCSKTFDRSEIERYRAAQLQAERLLEAREQSHRQQVQRLEHQVATLREQLNQEIKRRQQYVLRSTRAGREMQQLRQALGDSLRTVSQDPSLDALLLEHEARKLDNTLSNTASLPPGLSYERRSTTPQPK